jgi:hypothetical protein
VENEILKKRRERRWKYEDINVATTEEKEVKKKIKEVL